MNIQLEKEREFFFENYKDINPFKIFLYMIFSAGFYFLIWIYSNNRQLEKISENAPDTRRGFIILFAFPIFWYIISTIAKYIFFKDSGIFIYYINITGWVLIILLSLKYLYDFCIMFGEVTQTNGLGWYFLIYPGYYSIIFFFLNFYYTISLIVCFMITIPMMQSVLNDKAEEVNHKKNAQSFNNFTRQN